MGSALNEMFLDELSLCEVGRGQRVVVLTEGDQLRDYAEAALAAASALGAEAVDLNLAVEHETSASERIANLGHNSLRDRPDALAICCEADLVVDHMLLLFSREQLAMQRAGARVLLVVEPPEILERLFPSPALRRRVEAAERRLRAARRLRFTNGAGTDITYEIDPEAVLTEYGYTATPGRWDHWPGGFLATIAHQGRVSGRVVMQAGDILYPQKRLASEPIEFTVRDGRVLRIDGGRAAGELRDFIESYADPRANAVSHIGWGLNPACRWSVEPPGIGMDGRAHLGNVLFSLGPDTEFGGDNDTPCHLDLPMRHCSLWLDDEQILDHGELLPADLREACA